MMGDRAKLAFTISILCSLFYLSLDQKSHTITYAQIPVVEAEAITTPSPTATTNALSNTPIDLSHGRNQTRYYTVKPGDTVLLVALEIGIDLEEVGCVLSPDFKREQPLVIGDILEIPPPDVACHQVQRGETLSAIAAQYDVPPTQITALPWNRLTSAPDHVLEIGTYLRIPLLSAEPLFTQNSKPPESMISWMLSQPVNTVPLMPLSIGGLGLHKDSKTAPLPKTVPANWPFGSGNFVWPVYGWLSQNYHPTHRAIDVAAPQGTLVTAADRGVVMRAGWSDQGYGLFVVIDHNIDYVTLYAHLSEIYVEEGQVVGAGAPLGVVGSTGNSTGPHLHFEIRDFGRLADPLEFLLHWD